MRQPSPWWFVAAALHLGLACGAPVPDQDGGSPLPDSGVDAGASGDGGEPVDAGADAGSGDGGAGPPDAGATDAGSPDGGGPSSDAGTSDAGAALCDGLTGLVLPSPVCTSAQPCTRPLLGAQPITTPTSVPRCSTHPSRVDAGRPDFDDSPPQSRAGVDGTTRHGCVFTPAGATATSKRPLVVFFHGSGGGADDLYDSTSLRGKAVSFDLSGDPMRPGFVLVALQARNLHWPTTKSEDGSKHDLYHRDFGAPSSNPDVANADAWIDALVAGGTVDATRIYVMGWSNGARFAQAYGIARHALPTPGNARVRAAAVYSGTDPYETPDPSQSPACSLQARPQTTFPIMIVSRTCDVLPCNAAHAAALADAGLELLPGDVMQTWVDALTTTMGNPNVTWRRVNADGVIINACGLVSLCGPLVATLNHVRWPDGVADRGGNDHEPAMLSFLRGAP